VSCIKDNAQPSLPPVGLVFDGIDGGRSLCTLNGRRCDSNGQYGEQGVLSIWDVEINPDMGANDFFDVMLGKTREGGPNLCKATRLLIAS